MVVIQTLSQAELLVITLAEEWKTVALNFITLLGQNLRAMKMLKQPITTKSQQMWLVVSLDKVGIL